MSSSQSSSSEVATGEFSAGQFPTGRWLRAQREGRRLTIAQLAQQIALHPSTVRAVEERNRVLPPGWYAVLERAGFKCPRVQWPVGTAAYSGSQLALDLQQVPGFRHSIYWLSRQLAIPDMELRAVLRLDLAVPAPWLLKLAELGARVPDEIRAALAEAKRETARSSPDLGHSEGSAPAEDRDEDAPKPSARKESHADRSEAQTFSLTWSETSGLFISVSPGLLQDMQVGMRAAIQEIVRSPWFAESAAAGRRL